MIIGRNGQGGHCRWNVLLEDVHKPRATVARAERRVGEAPHSTYNSHTEVEALLNTIMQTTLSEVQSVTAPLREDTPNRWPRHSKAELGGYSRQQRTALSGLHVHQPTERWHYSLISSKVSYT